MMLACHQKNSVHTAQQDEQMNQSIMITWKTVQHPPLCPRAHAPCCRCGAAATPASPHWAPAIKHQHLLFFIYSYFHILLISQQRRQCDCTHGNHTKACQTPEQTFNCQKEGDSLYTAPVFVNVAITRVKVLLNQGHTVWGTHLI